MGSFIKFVLSRAGEAGRARLVGLIVLFIVVLAGAAAYVYWNNPARQAPDTVIVVVIDTLRQDALGCYGNPAEVSPALDALAAEGTRFDTAISASGWTLPSVASILTGTWPTLHGAKGKGLKMLPIRPEFTTAAELFKEAGYNTMAIANAAFVNPRLELNRGFDVFDHQHAYNTDIRRADASIDAALNYLKEHEGEHNFLFIHLFDPHMQYDPPEDYRYRFAEQKDRPPAPLGVMEVVNWSREERLTYMPSEAWPVETIPPEEDRTYIEGVYHGEVRFVDDQMKRLVDELKARGLYDNAAIAVTSDHGEEFWDHNGFEHGHTLYDELIRVPLIVKLPTDTPHKVRATNLQVRTLDIMPTFFELCGIQMPETFVGESLVRMIQGRETKDRLAFSEGTLYGPDELAWRDAEYKLVIRPFLESGPEMELYNWRKDPSEQKDLSDEKPDIAARLNNACKNFYGQIAQHGSTLTQRQPVDLSPEHFEELESLGYIR